MSESKQIDKMKSEVCLPQFNSTSDKSPMKNSLCDSLHMEIPTADSLVRQSRTHVDLDQGDLEDYISDLSISLAGKNIASKFIRITLSNSEWTIEGIRSNIKKMLERGVLTKSSYVKRERYLTNFLNELGVDADLKEIHKYLDCEPTYDHEQLADIYLDLIDRAIKTSSKTLFRDALLLNLYYSTPFDLKELSNLRLGDIFLIKREGEARYFIKCGMSGRKTYKLVIEREFNKEIAFLASHIHKFKLDGTTKINQDRKLLKSNYKGLCKRFTSGFSDVIHPSLPLKHLKILKHQNLKSPFKVFLTYHKRLMKDDEKYISD